MPTLNRVLIVYKKSSYQEHALDEKDANYLRLLREQDPVIQRSKSTHDVHMDTLETIRASLTDLKIPFDIKHRFELVPIRDYDLVITIGGDGTFLETSHYLEEGRILGINSVPHESVGYYCKSTAETFLDRIYLYLEGKARLKTLHRLEMQVDGEIKFPLALNDILFANQCPAGTTRYVLRIGKSHEEHKSSGIWISPAPGSTAAIHSAGGKKMPLESKDFQYVVREPYAPQGRKYHLLKGVLPPRQKIQIISMMDEAALFVDGNHRVCPVKRGSHIVIQHAARPIQAIWS